MYNVKCTSLVIFSCVWWLWNLRCHVHGGGEATGIFASSWQPPEGRPLGWGNSPSASCAKASRAPPSYSAPSSLQSWWLAPTAVTCCYWITKHFALMQKSVCETGDRLNDCSCEQSSRFVTGALKRLAESYKWLQRLLKWQISNSPLFLSEILKQFNYLYL